MNAAGAGRGRLVARSGQVVDRLDTPEGTAVLVDNGLVHRVLVLSPIGATVLDVLDEASGPLDLSALTDALVERLGAPEELDPEDLVWQAVDALTAEHVVVAET